MARSTLILNPLKMLFIKSCVSGRSLGVSRRNMPITAPMLCSTWMTKTFSSLPTKMAQPLFAGRIPRISTGTTSFFMRSLYGGWAKRQVPYVKCAPKALAFRFRTSSPGASFSDKRVGGVSKKHVGGFHHRLGQRGMRMYHLSQVPGGGAHFHRQHAFRDQFAGMMADNADAQDAFGLGIDDEFGQAIRPVEAQGAARGAPWEFN